MLMGIVAVLLLVAVGGFAAYKMWGNKMLGGYLAAKPGNGPAYDVAAVAKNPGSPLQGKTMIFLGSSVTEGYGACGVSFVEFLQQKDGVIPVKSAVCGTTLVTTDDASYIPRMKALDPAVTADAFVCQLSTNDAAKAMPLGVISESFDPAAFDPATIAGAIESIIAYAGATWNCPVIFYTGTRYDSEAYGTMVELLLKLQKKWGIGVIDLWNNTELNCITAPERALYMLDGVHPTKAGYLHWWLPAMEAYLEMYLAGVKK